MKVLLSTNWDEVYICDSWFMAKYDMVKSKYKAITDANYIASTPNKASAIDYYFYIIVHAYII